MQYQPRMDFNYSLSDEQKATVSKIVAKYDANSSDKSQFKSMMEELKSSGVPMSKDTQGILEAAGFKPPEKPQGPPPDGMPPQGEDGNSQIPDFLKSFMEKQQSGSVTENDIQALLQNLAKNGSSSQGVLVDEKA